MSSHLTLAQSALLFSILEGKTSIDATRDMVSKIPPGELFRWKCEIALKLREGKAEEALELADVWKDGDKYPEDIERMVELAWNQIEIDKMLLKEGIQPPPPAQRPLDQALVYIPLESFLDTPSSKNVGIEKNEIGNTAHLSYDLRVSLIKEYDCRKGNITKADYELISMKYNVTVDRIKVYFASRRKLNRKYGRQKSHETPDAHSTKVMKSLLH